MSNDEHKQRIIDNWDQQSERNKHQGTVALVDIAGIFHSTWHATRDLPVNMAFTNSVDAVFRILDSKKYVQVIACVDAPPYKRKQFYSEYKSKREEKDPEMMMLYERLQEKLVKMGVPVAKAHGYEADDCIATLTRSAQAERYSVEIYAMDKDLFQLVGPRVRIIDTYSNKLRDGSTRLGTVIDEQEVERRLGVPPSLVVDYQALVGDSTDDVPGCKGVGKVAATKLLSEFGSLDAILNAEISGKVGQLIRDQEEMILVSHALVSLVDDVPLDFEALMKKSERTAGMNIDDEPSFDDQLQSRARETVAPPAHQRQPEPEPEPVGGDKLVAGALVRQHVMAQARQEPQEQPRPLVKAEPRQELALTAGAGIELRPGLVIDDAKFSLLWRMSKAFNASGLYRRFDSVESVFTVIMRGQELGLGPQTALDSFHMIQGKPTMGAHLIIALAKKDPDCIYFECVAHDENQATYVARKRSLPGVELSFTYSIEDARNDNADWATKPKNRKAMLRKVAGSQASRLWFPASALGLHSMEEFGVDGSDIAA